MIALLFSAALLDLSAGDGATVAQVTVTQTLVVRTRARRAPAVVPVPQQTFREKRGPACISAGVIAGAAVTAPDAVDFILKGGKHVRAKLADECPALDFYRGFYVAPNPDGRICADRDSIRTRSGGDCQIDRFRTLDPIKPR